MPFDKEQMSKVMSTIKRALHEKKLDETVVVGTETQASQCLSFGVILDKIREGEEGVQYDYFWKAILNGHEGPENTWPFNQVQIYTGPDAAGLLLGVRVFLD